MLLQFPETPARVPGDELGEPEHDRDDQDGGQRQPLVQNEHRRQDPDHGKDAGQKRGDILRDGLVDGVDVVRQAAHQFARRLAVEKAHGQGLHVGEEIPRAAL